METERERNGITRPVVRTVDGNFFLTPTVCIMLVTLPDPNLSGNNFETQKVRLDIYVLLITISIRINFLLLCI